MGACHIGGNERVEVCLRLSRWHVVLPPGHSALSHPGSGRQSRCRSGRGQTTRPLRAAVETEAPAGTRCPWGRLPGTSVLTLSCGSRGCLAGREAPEAAQHPYSLAALTTPPLVRRAHPHSSSGGGSSPCVLHPSARGPPAVGPWPCSSQHPGPAPPVGTVVMLAHWVSQGGLALSAIRRGVTIYGAIFPELRDAFVAQSAPLGTACDAREPSRSRVYTTQMDG